MIRVRTQIGTWRLKDVTQSDTFSSIRKRLEEEHSSDLSGVPFTSDPTGGNVIPDESTVGHASLHNGDMIYAMVDETKAGIHKDSSSRKKIQKDGTIVSQDSGSVFNSSGFRPGMLPLRSMKMQWTLNEFVSLDEQFQFKITAQEKSICTLASLNSASIRDFQNYMFNFDFQIMRIGYLYGKFLANNSVKVEAIYEPPQEGTATSFTLADDSQESLVEALAGMLGLQKVGWVVAHPAREEGFHFSYSEVMMAAEQQLEAAQGIEDTPFVTVKVTIDEKSQSIVEAYQVSKQCMEMAAEGVLEPSVHLGCCAVNSTFTAIVEGKEAKEIDNSFFLTTVPIDQFESQFLVSTFPKANRIDVVPTRDDIKQQLSKAGKEGWSFSDLLADFHLLLYLTNFLSVQTDLPLLCKAVTDRDVPLDDGYQLLLRSIAGID